MVHVSPSSKILAIFHSKIWATAETTPHFTSVWTGAGLNYHRLNVLSYVKCNECCLLQFGLNEAEGWKWMTHFEPLTRLTRYIRLLQLKYMVPLKKQREVDSHAKSRSIVLFPPSSLTLSPFVHSILRAWLFTAWASDTTVRRSCRWSVATSSALFHSVTGYRHWQMDDSLFWLVFLECVNVREYLCVCFHGFSGQKC